MVRRRLSFVLFGLFLAVGAASACSDDPTRPPPAGNGLPTPPLQTGTTEAGVDSGTDARDSGSKDAADAGVCTDVPLTGLLVDRIGVVGDPPVSSGGVVVDGIYDLTVYTVYVGAGGVGGPTGITARSTIRIAAGMIEQVLELGGGTPLKTVRSKGTYNATAATFATTELCPTVGGGGQRQYTSADPQLVLTDLVTKEAFTFVKR
jgi:hypothetical protein